MKLFRTILGLIFISTGHLASGQISGTDNFTIENATVASATGEMMSESFSAISAVGEPSPVGEMSSESFAVESGQLSVEVPIVIDVMPADTDNTINTRRRGSTPVAIFSSLEFDATQDIDLLSLTFGRSGTEQSLSFCPRDMEDVNGDGIPDQMCFFDTQLTGLEVGDTEAVLRGVTSDGGTNLRGIDAVIVPR